MHTTSVPSIRRCVSQLVAVITCAAIGCGVAAGKKDGGDTSRQSFDAARQLMVDGQYQAGAEAFERFVDREPNGKFSSRAGLFLGKAYMALDDLAVAEKWFQWTVDNHGATPEGHKCRYKLALCAMLAGRRDEAIDEFRQLSDQPDGPLCAEATAMLRYLQQERPAAEVADDAELDR